MNFADHWGYGSLLLVNLFALRSTDPRALRLSDDPQGPRANEWLRRASRESALVIAAWGNGGHLLDRANGALPWIENPHCLGLTASGMPKHPLYCPKTSQPLCWSKPPTGHNSRGGIRRKSVRPPTSIPITEPLSQQRLRSLTAASTNRRSLTDHFRSINRRSRLNFDMLGRLE